MANPRQRGKIPGSEWPQIATRFAAGETLTEIARSYGCTAPAIRYIVNRQSRADRGSLRRQTVEYRPSSTGERAALERRTIAQDVLRSASRALPHGERVPESFWARVSSDIATFLAAMDAMIADENEATQTVLLEAADRLLRASALTRLEIERIRGKRQLPVRAV
jgi:Lon protease-like protein